MITKLIYINGDAHTTYPNGRSGRRAEYYGKAADTKPTAGVKNGDISYEMDTKKAYMFDEETSEWLEQ